MRHTSKDTAGMGRAHQVTNVFYYHCGVITLLAVDHPCKSPGRGEHGADRGNEVACQASFLAQDVLRKGAGGNNSAFNPCGWKIQDVFDYEMSLMNGPKDPNNSLSAVEAVSYMSFMKMAENSDQLMRNTLAKLRFEIAQSSVSGTPELGDAAFITISENCSDAAPEEVLKRSDGRVKDCNSAKDNGMCSMMHQMCKRSCGQCQEGQGDSQSLTPAPAPDSSIECPKTPSWALTAIKKYSRCNQGCQKPCQEFRQGVPVEECSACKEPFQCRPGALFYDKIPDSGNHNNQPPCQPQCENPCTQLNGDVKRECGACPAPAKCRPGQPGFDSRQAHHEQPQCQPQCQNPCTQLNGDVKRECGACSGASSSKCRPGAPGFDNHHHQQPQCQSQCGNPCTQLNGDVKHECGACSESAKCRPGAPGFDSNHHEHPPCQPHCENPCSQLDGDVKRECGACHAPAKCRPGQPGFESKNHSDATHGAPESRDELLLLDEFVIPRKSEITGLDKLYEDTNLLELGEASGRRGGRSIWARAIYFSAGANRAGARLIAMVLSKSRLNQNLGLQVTTKKTWVQNLVSKWVMTLVVGEGAGEGRDLVLVGLASTCVGQQTGQVHAWAIISNH